MYYHISFIVKQAVELGQKAIWHATHRDAYSGGVNNVYLVKETGWVKKFSLDVMVLHDRYAKKTEE